MYFGTVFINDGIPVHVYLEKKILGTVLLMSQSELCKKCCKDLTPLIFVKIRYKIKNIKYYFGCFYSILSLMIDRQYSVESNGNMNSGVWFIEILYDFA